MKLDVQTLLALRPGNAIIVEAETAEEYTTAKQLAYIYSSSARKQKGVARFSTRKAGQQMIVTAEKE